MTTIHDFEKSEGESDASLSDAHVFHERDNMAPSQFEDVIVNHDSYGIRLTDTADGRNSASMLINKMYAWRGYAGTHQFTDDPNRITLTATDKGEVVGTLTIGIDAPIGLMADQIFKKELDEHRSKGARQEGDLKINPRVDAPAYLLRVNFEYVTEQIRKFGGTFSTEEGADNSGVTDKSFYPYFFSPREERGIINRLLRMDDHHA
jgi:hypothetical protein